MSTEEREREREGEVAYFACQNPQTVRLASLFTFVLCLQLLRCICRLFSSSSLRSSLGLFWLGCSCANGLALPLSSLSLFLSCFSPVNLLLLRVCVLTVGPREGKPRFLYPRQQKVCYILHNSSKRYQKWGIYFYLFFMPLISNILINIICTVFYIYYSCVYQIVIKIALENFENPKFIIFLLK